MNIDFLAPNIVYFTGNGSLPSSTSGGVLFKNVALGIVIDMDTADILGANINLLNPLANSFVEAQLLGCNLERDWDKILKRLERFQAPAQKAVIVALKSIRDKYYNYMKES